MGISEMTPSNTRASELDMIIAAGYEPRPEGDSVGYWFRGARIGKFRAAVEHCHKRQEEIVRSQRFLEAEGYVVTPRGRVTP